MPSAASSAASAVRLWANASEMYFRKINPSTTCLYDAASIEPRNVSAAFHSVSSKPSGSACFFVRGGTFSRRRTAGR